MSICRLRCVKCGTLFDDVWDVDGPPGTWTIPTCPMCRASWFGETEEEGTPYPVGHMHPTQVPEEVGPEWQPYYMLQELVTHWPGIDLRLAHEKGLALMGMRLEDISWTRVLFSLLYNSQRNHQQEVVGVSFEHEADPDLSPEEQTLLHAEVEAFRQRWATKSDVPLDDVLDWGWPGKEATDEERRVYYALRRRLSRFRRAIVQKQGD